MPSSSDQGQRQRTFVDLFSGAGGMTFGFHSHPAFSVTAAFDAEFGKPSSRRGSLGCNSTFQMNMGITPTRVDLSEVDDGYIAGIREGVLEGRDLDVLSACPPCTGFSRANPNNHIEDDSRNSLVFRTERWIRGLRPRVVVMENARELIRGNFSHHFRDLRRVLEYLGYDLKVGTHFLNEFGLPQRRERALVVATNLSTGAKGLDDLWAGYQTRSEATTVRRAIAHLPAIRAGERDIVDHFHVSPKMSDASIARIDAIPRDGGSWFDLCLNHDFAHLLTPAMKRQFEARDFGSHPDVYGRMAWDRPAVTVKRECSHVGNGRYAHPTQNRLCSVRELALIQGFPAGYQFGGASLSNQYRHIGDAVPPMVSFQLANIADWMFTGERPDIRSCVLPGTSLSASDIEEVQPTASALRPHEAQTHGQLSLID